MKKKHQPTFAKSLQVDFSRTAQVTVSAEDVRGVRHYVTVQMERAMRERLVRTAWDAEKRRGSRGPAWAPTLTQPLWWTEMQRLRDEAIRLLKQQLRENK